MRCGAGRIPTTTGTTNDALLLCGRTMAASQTNKRAGTLCVEFRGSSRCAVTRTKPLCLSKASKDARGRQSKWNFARVCKAPLSLNERGLTQANTSGARVWRHATGRVGWRECSKFHWLCCASPSESLAFFQNFCSVRRLSGLDVFLFWCFATSVWEPPTRVTGGSEAGAASKCRGAGLSVAHATFHGQCQ